MILLKINFKYYFKDYKENDEYLSMDDDMDDSKVDMSFDFNSSKQNDSFDPRRHASSASSSFHHRHKMMKLDPEISFNSFPNSGNMAFFQSSQRRLFPPNVVEHLEKIFDTQKYVNEKDIQCLISTTQLNEKQIRSWFKQRRYRFNLENKQNGVTEDFGLQQRIMLPKNITDELENAFQKNNYISGTDKKNLIRKLDLRPSQIERWFYYRRKKQSKK